MRLRRGLGFSHPFHAPEGEVEEDREPPSAEQGSSEEGETVTVGTEDTSSAEVEVTEPASSEQLETVTAGMLVTSDVTRAGDDTTITADPQEVTGEFVVFPDRTRRFDLVF